MPSRIRHDDLLLRVLKDLNDVRAALKQVVAQLPLFDIDNENTPAQLTADQNNYNPGNYDVLRLSSDANRAITGISRGIKGRKLRIYNIGNYAITLIHASLDSTAANRFNFSSGTDAVILPNANISLYYDSTQERWIGGDQQANGPPFMLVYNDGNQSIGVGAGTYLTGTVILDQYGFYDTVNKRVDILFDGVYSVTVNFFITAANTGINNIAVHPNGDEGIDVAWGVATAPNDEDGYGLTIAFSRQLSAGEYFTVKAYHTDPGFGAAANITNYNLSMTRTL